jgi:hypothetical protein
MHIQSPFSNGHYIGSPANLLPGGQREKGARPWKPGMSYDISPLELPENMGFDAVLEMREQRVLDDVTPAPVEGRNEPIITALVAKTPRLNVLRPETHTVLDEGAGGERRHGVTVRG